MRILLLTQLFQPEPNHLKGLAFATELVARGHAVEVLTGAPNYPGGRVYPGYRVRWRQLERMGEVRVHRVPLFPSHSRSGLGRIACYSSFALSASILGSTRVRRPDVVHVYHGPATLSLPAAAIARRFDAPIVMDVQDLWPDSVLASGMFDSRIAAKVMEVWCARAYRAATRIVVLSNGYRDALVSRGVERRKIDVVYNWSDERHASTQSTTTPGLAREGRFEVLYAGNFGPLQALDSVLDAARLLRDRVPGIRFVFAGSGVDEQTLRRAATDAGLSNVSFIGRVPADSMPAILAQADALLIHLKDEPLGLIGVPQKTQSYLAAARPIVMATRGEAAELVRLANAGVFANPCDGESIARAVEALYRMDPIARETLGRNGRRFYDSKLCFAVGVSKMLDTFAAAHRDHSGVTSDSGGGASRT